MELPLEKEKDRIVVLPRIRRKLKTAQGDQFTAASFYALAENALDIICRFDRQYMHLYVNPAIEKATGIPTVAFMGKAIHEVGLPTEFAEFWNMQIEQVFITQRPGTFEFTFPSNDGIKYYQTSVVPEFNEFGVIETVLTISRDITSIRQHEKEKDELLAMVTHELRAPVTSVKAFAQLLSSKMDHTDDKEKKGYFSKLNNQIDRLNKYITDLLDATRVGAGKMQFKPKTFSFYELLKEMVDDIQKTTSTHTLKIVIQERAKIFADRGRISQVLVNLLSNAIKYSPENTPITIETNIAKGLITCIIHNEGPEIPKEKQKKLFQRFSRLTDIHHNESAGLGLGLYISSEIVKQSGGKIWIESEKGKGVTFSFALPIKPEASQKAAKK